jgi:hypothetical protein
MFQCLKFQSPDFRLTLLYLYYSEVGDVQSIKTENVFFEYEAALCGCPFILLSF